MWATYNSIKRCVECGLGFTTHSTAVVVKCPDCGAEFEYDEAETARITGRPE